jgi:phage terminase large subunit GpA-like protein
MVDLRRRAWSARPARRTVDPTSGEQRSVSSGDAMGEPAPCPHCGRRAAGEDGQAGTARDALDSLTREVERLRALAEARAAGTDRQRIDELSREVWQLRETVARLRGAAAPLVNRR